MLRHTKLHDEVSKPAVGIVTTTRCSSHASQPTSTTIRAECHAQTATSSSIVKNDKPRKLKAKPDSPKLASRPVCPSDRKIRIDL